MPDPLPQKARGKGSGIGVKGLVTADDVCFKINNFRWETLRVSDLAWPLGVKS